MHERYTTVEAVRDVLAPNPSGDPASQAVVASTAASLDDATITDQIAEAASKVDLYLGALYTVPLTEPAPDQVSFWTRDIAAWLCHLIKRRNAPIDQNDPVRLRWASAMAELTAVRDGKTVLPVPRLPDGNQQTGYAEVFNPYEGNLFLPQDVLTSTGSEAYLDTRNVDWPYW